MGIINFNKPKKQEKDFQLLNSLQGSPKNTIFQNSDWVQELFQCCTCDEVTILMRNTFKSRFNFVYGKIYQLAPAIWDEIYGLLSLFNNETNNMYISVSKDDFEADDFNKYKIELYSIIESEKVYAALKWISPNDIKAIFSIQPDSNKDCNITFSTILDKNGKPKQKYKIAI